MLHVETVTAKQYSLSFTWTADRTVMKRGTLHPTGAAASLLHTLKTAGHKRRLVFCRSCCCCFVAGSAGTSFLVMPTAYSAVVGKPLWDLSPAGQADFALWSEIVVTFVTFGILANVASR